MTDDEDQVSQGTAPAAKLEKAACGIRFSEDELREGIDFSGAVHLKPDDDPASATPSDGASHD